MPTGAPVGANVRLLFSFSFVPTSGYHPSLSLSPFLALFIPFSFHMHAFLFPSSPDDVCTSEGSGAADGVAP